MTREDLVPIDPYAAAAAAEQQFHYIVVRDYGSNGCKPRYRSECPLGADYPDVSCVSGSGDSLCGQYSGHVAVSIVKCSKT
jgi:hypothetical protein